MDWILPGGCVLAALLGLAWAAFAHPVRYQSLATLLVPVLSLLGVLAVLFTTAGLYSTVLGLGKGTTSIEADAVGALAKDLRLILWLVGVPTGVVAYLTFLRLLPRLLGHEREGGRVSERGGS